METEEKGKTDLINAPEVLMQMALQGGRVLARERQYLEADTEFNDYLRSLDDTALRVRAEQATNSCMPSFERMYERYCAIHELCSTSREHEQHRLFTAIFNGRYHKTVVVKEGNRTTSRVPAITFGKNGFGIRWNQQAHNASKDEFFKHILPNKDEVLKGLRQYRALLDVATDFENFISIVTKDVGSTPNKLEVPIARPFVFIASGYSRIGGYSSGVAEVMRVDHTDELQQHNYRYYRTTNSGKPPKPSMTLQFGYPSEVNRNNHANYIQLSLNVSGEGKLGVSSSSDKTHTVLMLAVEERVQELERAYMEMTKVFLETEDALNVIRKSFARRVLLTEV